MFPRKRNLEREQDEIKKENTQRKQEIQTLKEVIELKKNEAEREKKYLKEALEEQEELKNQLSSDEFNLPQTLEKDIDKLKRLNDNQKRAKAGLQLFSVQKCLAKKWSINLKTLLRRNLL